MTYFTKWLYLLLSIASPYRVQISLLHHATKSSVHLLLGLPLLFLSSIMPKTACFRSLSYCILHVWLRKFNFLSIILCTILMLVPVLFMISVFLIFCCHFAFDNLLRHFISKAWSQFMSLFFKVHISAIHYTWAQNGWISILQSMSQNANHLTDDNKHTKTSLWD